ncbi:MAG: metallophosphoesterase [Candidatus Omnitrophica bacterium]|nr:metallophosphoesterase [Candidatus Omnitrophota bacterium]
MYKFIFIVFILVLFSIFSIPLKIFAISQFIEIGGKTIFISDIHLNLNSKKIEIEDAKNLVIVGDLFAIPKIFEIFSNGSKDELKDELISKRYLKIQQGFSKVLGYFNKIPENLYYIPGNMDPIYLKNFSFKCNETNVYGLNNIVAFKINNITIVAHHGHFIAKGRIDFLISLITKRLRKPLLLEKLWKNKLLKKLNLDNFWLIVGHSHIPAIDYKEKIANCGGWKDYILKKAERAYVVVEDNNILLKHVDKVKS